MNGDIGSIVFAAALGSPTARAHVDGIFQPPFRVPAGWRDMLAHMPAEKVEHLLNRSGTWWTRGCFQALYVACWIHHPVEKGTFMLQLAPAHYTNVKNAYQALTANGGLQTRISSHLSKRGASAHEGWAFLNGYGELLLQIEGENTGAPYLMLKAEGHALSGFSLGTILHGASYVKKKLSGAGSTASPALKRLAQSTHSVEARAAENFSPTYEKLLSKLGLDSVLTTVEEMVEQLHRKAGFTGGLPQQIKGNTHLLGRAMLGAHGYIALFERQKDTLRRNKIKWTDHTAEELRDLANRMVATAVAHPCQYFNEVRVTPAELDASLTRFRTFIG